jgi:hypothetical protein
VRESRSERKRAERERESREREVPWLVSDSELKCGSCSFHANFTVGPETPFPSKQYLAEKYFTYIPMTGAKPPS